MNHLQNCVGLNIQASISDERCSDKNRYICEYANPQMAPCVSGWTNYSTGCYSFPSGLADPWSMVTWDQAKQKCATTLTGTTASSITPHLLFIESKDEMNYIQHQLPLISLTSQIWWIGMSDSASEGQYKWTDGRPVDTSLVFWAQEPNNLGGVEKCGYINRNASVGDLNCSATESYICMKEHDVTSNPLSGLGCPLNWVRAGQYCYLIETNDRQNWQDAQNVCRRSNSNLIKMDSIDKKTWIEMQNTIFESGLWFWTGLNYLHDNQWQWVDGSAADMSFIKWNTEPNNYKGNEGCAVLLKSGTFNDVLCTLLAGFICQLNTEDAPCPSGWISHNVGDQTKCYYISKTTATYDEAHAKCTQLSFPMTSYLMAYSTPAELDWTISQVQSQTSNITMWYTGLTDVDHEGFWTFDTSFNPSPPAGAIPWTTFPRFGKGNENCVSILFGANYINNDCNVKQPYICERLAMGASSGAESRIFRAKYSISSVTIIGLYFIIYGICLHYILHLTYVFPAFA
ncbi:mannose binding [Mactra antiquata]